MQPGDNGHVALGVEAVIVLAPARREDAIAPLPGAQGGRWHTRLMNNRLGVEEWQVRVGIELWRLNPWFVSKHRSYPPHPNNGWLIAV